MNARWMMVGALTLGFSLACAGGGGDVVVEEPKPVELSPEEKAATIAKAIEADPTTADAALQEQGMSAEEFEALMFDIAKDPKRTDAFLEARK